jgi:hypothetical protein
MVAEKEKRKAQHCLSCLLCRYARKKQKGLLFWLVKKIQDLCPFCIAYEKVYGRKAHEPIPEELKS